MNQQIEFQMMISIRRDCQENQSIFFQVSFSGENKLKAQWSRAGIMQGRCEIVLLIVLIWDEEPTEAYNLISAMSWKNSKEMCLKFRPESSICSLRLPVILLA